jgi:NADH-quinone oxidoreductase subunit L
MTVAWLVAIPLLPALAFALLAPLSRTLRNRARWISVACTGASLLLSLIAFVRVIPGGEEAAARGVYHAFLPIAPTAGIGFGLLLDPVSAVMLLVVTIVALCVQVYSLGYMHTDERVGWYYAVLSLFTAAMLTVVLADNFLQLYMAWEVMGLCSYLLIGFWHTEEGPRKASLKAFLVTRVGDIGFGLALVAMYAATAAVHGGVGSFSFADVLPSAANWAPGSATVVALLLLFGAMGKSAQFPLHVWLPDAMAGPTPASALIHAATMVAAGVYLVLRALPVFVASGTALTVTMVIGIITALLGGSLALVQYDIKKVLAYSTISQLGYMFVALGAGSEVAALYHLTTHAFFKSLLFLGAGVIIHSTHTQDMREMGGLMRKMPVTTAVFTIGALALAGVVPLSGFFSKDEILAELLRGHHYVVLVLALLAALVTAFYCTRLWVRVFWGEGSDHAHEGHRVMLAPMVVLAAITVVLGLASVAFAGFLGFEGEWPALALGGGSTLVALGGVALGWWVYALGGVDTAELRRRLEVPYAVLQQKYYMDWLYEKAFIAPYFVVADALAAFDAGVVDAAVNGAARLWVAVTKVARRFDVSVIDGTVNRTADAVVAAGGNLRKLQTGRVQNYQRLIVGALVLLMAWVMWLWPLLKAALKGA